MTTQTFTHHDTLALASSLQSIYELIDNITTNGVLSQEYQYIYDSLFVVFNRIYNGGSALDNKFVDDKQNETNRYFDNAHYHMAVAIGLAAGVITAPGVQPEVDLAQGALRSAQENMQSLANNASQIIANPETLNYVQSLQKATTDPKINVNELIKTLMWTIIVSRNTKTLSLLNFNDAIAEIHLNILNLKNAGWKGLFSLEGLTLNLDGSNTKDDLEKITTIVSDLGDLVGVAAIIVMAYNWKATGTNPMASFTRLYQGVRLKFSGTVTSEDAAAEMGTAESLAEATPEMTVADALGGVLSVVGALLLIVGTIVEIVELTKSMNKISDSKDDFNKQYGDLKANVLSVIAASEGFRRHS